MALAKVPRPISYAGSFTTAREVLYTAPSNSRAQITSIGFTTVSGSSTTVELYTASTDSRINLFLNHTTSPTYTDEMRLVLQPGDRIEVTPNGTSPESHAFVTVDEVFIPVG